MTREEMLACLTDRPCDACKFHTEKGCKRWSCVFEEEPDDVENKGFDGMTNGEVIQALFPYVKTEDTSFDKLIGTDLDKSYVPLQRAWWNAPYKAEKKVSE